MMVTAENGKTIQDGAYGLIHCVKGGEGGER